LRSKSAVCPSGERETQRIALEKPAVFARIEVRNSHLAVWLMHPSAEGADESTGPPAPIEENSALLIPWTKPPAKRFKEMVQGDPASSLDRKISRAAYEGGATYRTDQIHRARTCLARRDRLWHCQHRSHCRAPEVQRSLRQHDDIDGIHRAGSGQGRHRRAASARHRHRHLA